MTIANPNDWERLSGRGANARWGVAALAVLTAHAAAAWFFVQMPPVEQAPAGAPEAPILIELAPPASAPSAPAVEAPAAETPTEPEAMPEPTPEPVVTPPPPEPLPPEPGPAPVEEPIVEPPEPLPPEPEPVVPPPELPQTEAPTEAVLNVPVPRARPTPPPREVAEREPPRQRQRPAPRREEPKPRAERRAAPPPSRASAARPSANASQGAATRSNVSPARWQAQVQARLNRFKRTPRGGGAGTVQVSFTISGSGAAGGIRLRRSSGNPVLDEAALSLVRRASPFPAPPDGSSISLSVPIAFSR